MFKWKYVFEQIPEILRFFPTTILVVLGALIISLVLGLVLAIIRIKKIPVLSQLTRLYISIIRGTPLIIQILIVYYGFTLLFMNTIDDFSAASIDLRIYAILSLGFYQASYTTEIIRGALESVNKGEIEAAQAAGMTYWQILRRIIIPEALEIALPGLVNSLISLLKGTSLIFSIGVIDMYAQAKIIAGRTFRYLEGYVALAIIYWVLTVILEQVVKVISDAVKIPDQPNEPRFTGWYAKLYRKIKKTLNKKQLELATENDSAKKSGDLDVRSEESI
jgi:polar amino acid transport system permease protein